MCEGPRDCDERYFFCILGFCVSKKCIFDKTCRRHNPSSGYRCRKTTDLDRKNACQKSKTDGVL